MAGEGYRLVAKDLEGRSINVIGTIETFISQAVDGTNRWHFLTDVPEYVSAEAIDYTGFILNSDTELVHDSIAFEGGGGTTDIRASVNRAAFSTFSSYSGAGEANAPKSLTLSKGDILHFDHTGGGGTGSGFKLAALFDTDFTAAGPAAAPRLETPIATGGFS